MEGRDCTQLEAKCSNQARRDDVAGRMAAAETERTEQPLR